MCGINGFLVSANGSVLPDEGLVAAMNNAIRHRGPDDGGVWLSQDHGLALGHRRLSILDLSPSGHQPMMDERGNVIVFNGEIFNYRELNEQYLPGERFRSTSDTETILKMYARFGERCVDYFNGMFAFALWDARKEQLFLARDRSGKKPLYYTERNGVFAFSSEVKALLTLPWVRAELDEEALYHFLTFNLMPPPYTGFKAIKKFLPAHSMRVTRQGISHYAGYWDIGYTDCTALSEAALAERVLSELRTAVRYRMVSDVPVGLFFSGGVDSSAMLALMAEQTDKPIRTFSIGFEGVAEADERAHAAAVAKRYNTDHHEKTVAREEISGFISHIVEIFDEPLSDTTAIPIYFLAELARGHDTKVVLTGDAADELFAGYRGYRKYIELTPAYRVYSRLPTLLKRGVADIVEKVRPYSPAAEILRRAEKGEELFWPGASGLKESVKQVMLRSEFLARSSASSSNAVIAGYRREFERHRRNNKYLTELDWMCYVGYRFVDIERFLFRSDRLAMAHGVETRSPFLDSRFVDLALSVPFKWKYLDGEPKHLLKKALEPVLSKDILYRRKQGFCVPIEDWIGHDIVGAVESRKRTVCEAFPIFDAERLTDLVSQYRAGNKHVVGSLWTVYFLINWLEKWF